MIWVEQNIKQYKNENMENCPLCGGYCNIC